MENKKIDFVVHEADMNRMERANKRLMTITIIILILFTGLLGYTIWLLNDISVEETTNTQEIHDIDSVGGNITNGDYYGDNKTDNNN